MTRNWKRWTIPRAFHPGAEYEKEVEQSASFKEDIPLSACCLTVLEALDVMLELTRVQPGFYSKDGLHEPFLLRFTGNGKGAGYLFSVAWLDAATHIATVPRMKGERIIWISESGSFGEIDLPRHHFFAARQKDGTHRFFGSNEPEKI